MRSRDTSTKYSKHSRCTLVGLWGGILRLFRCNRWVLAWALWAVSSVFGTTLLARDVEQDLRDFMRLVFKSPDSFGFRDKAEAEQARLGRSYALYGVDEWKDIVRKSGGVGTADPDQAPDKLYEVLAESGEPRCVFSYSQASDGSGFSPLKLGAILSCPDAKSATGETQIG